MKFNINKIEQNRLYGELSHFYPYVIVREDYEPEASYWHSILKYYFPARKVKLLEMASGPGYLISYLSECVDAEVVDLSEEMLCQCGSLNPRVKCHKGDMRNIRLENKYDAVLVHDGIGHIDTVDGINDVCVTASAHLVQGGLFMLSPEFDADEFTKPMIYHVTRKTPFGLLTIIDYINKSSSNTNILQTTTSYILDNEEGTNFDFDSMTLGLFGANVYKTSMEKAGFDVTIDRKPKDSSGETRTVLIGVKK
ncbi:methyltransferase domain-containing protein [Pseudoalteromonas aliena]|uniref:Methyltransferase domain-containing protein n=2 Tax=Pseudoalteromonas aliena TaxID=247523 RepID=A0ABR9E199_9GAMM|nr:class I SAM-dependent methyltransferase [Pseudoalteromonas aliena]MBE0359214.1 hypothetical protein [Pseudoalteromonas aliena SW19]